MSAAVTAFAPFIRSSILLFCERQAIKTINCYEAQHQNENHIFVPLATIGAYTNVRSERIKKHPKTCKKHNNICLLSEVNVRGQFLPSPVLRFCTELKAHEKAVVSMCHPRSEMQSPEF